MGMNHSSRRALPDKPAWSFNMTMDPNTRRPLDDDRRRPLDDERDGRPWSWGILAVLAILIIGGLVYYGSRDRTQTASTGTSSPATQSGPTTTGGPGMTTNPPAAPK
jgi:hypothetical protein